MTGCSAVSCSNRSDQGFKMKVFPKDPRIRAIWESKVKRPNWKSTNYSCLCEIHFDEDQWETTVSGQRKLKSCAVPTLFPHVTPVVKLNTVKMWKNINLERPVDDFCEYNAEDDLIIEDFSNLVGLLTASAEMFTKDHPLWTEIKVFQNVQARYRRILHCDKCLQLLQKVGTYLRKMVLLNLSKSYLDLAEPFLKEIQSRDMIKLLPSQQQLEYILIRTQAAAKLICEALHYSRETFCYLIQRLKVGHMVLNLMMATSVTARVNILFKGILVQIIDFYHKIYLWRDKLKIGDWKWPQPLNLPENLEEWLNLESDLMQPKELPTEQLSFLKNIYENQNNTSQNDTDSVVEIESEDNECMIIADTSQQSDSMDFGEVISRDEENDITSTTPEENPLLLKIKEAKSYKKLRTIWDDIEMWNSEGALPQQLTPKTVNKINKMFDRFLLELNKVKDMRLTDVERKKENKQIKKRYRIKFSRHLHLLSDPSIDSVNHDAELKPVNTYNELLNLYQALYDQLKSAKKKKLCKELRGVFKRQESDIQLLMDNKEKILAKQLILCTSKILLTKYKL